MDAMTDPRSVGLVGSLPQNVFNDAFRLLSPAHFLEPYRHLHHTLHTWGVLMQGIKPLEAVFDDFARALLKIMEYRVAAGSPPQLAEYTHLLDCAQAMGNGPMANELWRSIHANNVIPDIVCYNHYMTAKVWDHCYIGKEAYNLRILPYSYKKRRMDNPNPGWRGFATGLNSVKRLVLDVFSEMSEDNIGGNEETYVNVLLASARVGDRVAAKNILKAVWNVNVDSIMTESDVSMIPPATPYEPGSDLYPTGRLLFAVAHAFGTMSDIHAAIETVKFIASSYSISIPDKVWYELFERTYTLSKDYKRRQANDGRRGQVSRTMVCDMFKTITAEPYNVPATLQMYRFMTQVHIMDGNLEACKTDMRKASEVLSETRAKMKGARDIIIQLLQPVLDSMIPPAEEITPPQNPTKRRRLKHRAPDLSLLQCPRLAEAIHTYDILRLEVFQQVYLMQRIAYAMVIKQDWQDTSTKSWELQERPKLLEEWKDFLPRRNVYEYRHAEAGSVEFHGKTTAHSRYLNQFGLAHARRMPDHPEVFHPVENKTLDENIFWKLLLRNYPRLDTTISPLSRLYSFQNYHSEQLQEKLEKFQTWVDYPDDHRLSQKQNPAGGFYGRIHALGFEVDPRRSIFWQDGSPWSR
ncbi:hypothetical protein N7475_009571 [Penicillium sp. IBT 31633x]|nr:hypothetical protein N7475_009571 [Penicillium sp. IBT 31633x]